MKHAISIVMATLFITCCALAGHEPSPLPKGLWVQAKVIYVIDKEPATKPEEWIVQAVQKDANNDKKDAPVAADGLWQNLQLDKPIVIEAKDSKITATLQAGEPLKIRLTYQSGDARAVASLELEAKAGARQVTRVTSGGTYLALQVVQEKH